MKPKRKKSLRRMVSMCPHGIAEVRCEDCMKPKPKPNKLLPKSTKRCAIEELKKKGGGSDE